jgi:hypothetical protein
VFVDNAGIIKFDDEDSVCIKVETHNRPSAIEPFGGAGTGVGGVIRDVLGTGLGARPIANTDVFCFAPPTCPDEVPQGCLHPLSRAEGRRRRRARLRQPDGHPDRQRQRALRRELRRQPARLRRQHRHPADRARREGRPTPAT